MSCELTEKDTYRVADFGTADGANFLNIVQNIKGKSDCYIVNSEKGDRASHM